VSHSEAKAFSFECTILKKKKKKKKNVNAEVTTTNRAAILVKPNASTAPSVTCSESNKEDGNAEVASPESIRQLDRALPSVTDTAVVVVTSMLGQSTLDAPLGNHMSYWVIQFQSSI
jgi:hypothetical protein